MTLRNGNILNVKFKTERLMCLTKITIQINSL